MKGSFLAEVCIRNSLYQLETLIAKWIVKANIRKYGAFKHIRVIEKGRIGIWKSWKPLKRGYFAIKKLNARVQGFNLH